MDSNTRKHLFREGICTIQDFAHLSHGVDPWSDEKVKREVQRAVDETASALDVPFRMGSIQPVPVGNGALNRLADMLDSMDGPPFFQLSDLISCAEAKGYPVDPGLKKFVPSPERQNKPGGKREMTRNRIIRAMAVDRYGHDPSAKKNGSIALIAAACARAGTPVDEDTIRDVLKDACAAVRQSVHSKQDGDQRDTAA